MSLHLALQIYHIIALQDPIRPIAVVRFDYLKNASLLLKRVTENWTVHLSLARYRGFLSAILELNG
jgi:hypothetical protein